jgi:hypothetical protein
MSDREPKELADRLEREADELEHRSGELEGRVKAAGEDWERKRADQSVPGAAPPEGREDEHDAAQTSSPASDAPPPDTGD